MKLLRVYFTTFNDEEYDEIKRELEKLCDRIAIIDHGKIIALGTPRELKSMVGDDIITIYFKADGFNPRVFIRRLRELLNGNPIGVSGNIIKLSVKDAPKVIPIIFEIARETNVNIVKLEYSSASLDDVFLKLTGRRIREEFGSWSDFVRARIRRRFRR